LGADYIAWLRSRIGRRKTIVVYATAVIHDERRRILFQRRTDFRDAWWGLPGGALEIGETLAECAMREAFEETGLTVEPVRLVGVYTGPQYDVRYPNGDEVQQWTAAFECRIVGGQARADGEEASEVAFCAETLLPCPSWYAAMAQDTWAGAEAATFEPPRAAPTGDITDYIRMMRSVVGQERFIAPAAGGGIRDERGRILLARRADNGTWNPPGGFMDLGESIAETVLREVCEEVGLVVEPTRLVGVYSGRGNQYTYPNGDQVQGCASLFECRVVGGELRVDESEINAVDYFPLGALPSPLPARWRQRLADLAANYTHAVFR